MTDQRGRWTYTSEMIAARLRRPRRAPPWSCFVHDIQPAVEQRANGSQSASCRLILSQTWETHISKDIRQQSYLLGAITCRNIVSSRSRLGRSLGDLNETRSANDRCYVRVINGACSPSDQWEGYAAHCFGPTNRHACSAWP